MVFVCRSPTCQCKQHLYVSTLNDKLGHFGSSNHISGCSYYNGNKKICDCRKLKNSSPKIYQQLCKDSTCDNRGISNFEELGNSSNKKACFICVNQKCRKHFVSTISDRTYHKTGCPNCVKVSKFHYMTRDFLNEFNLNGAKLAFDVEKSFTDLRGDSRELAFDFIVEDNLLIEIDGDYHFKPSGGQNG
uniref:DUF559 domain-containing protein n=1 Tax=Rhabditophanes sp. KR3021 TaxID=114890 RepID=A0AC35TJL1_9BILA